MKNERCECCLPSTGTERKKCNVCAGSCVEISRSIIN